LIIDEDSLHGSGLDRSAGVQLGLTRVDLAREGADGLDGRHTAEAHLAGLCGLNREGFAHNRATTTKSLEV
jgi:hypothetical protein